MVQSPRTQPVRPLREPGRAACAVLLSGLLVAAGAVGTGAAQAGAPPSGSVDLMTAAPFAVLAGSTVTNTGPSVLTGDVGVSPGTAVTGFPPGIVNGTIHANDSVATQGQDDVTVAYNNFAGRPSTLDLTGQDLGGLTLTPGVASFDTSAQLTGTLTLDGQGDPDAEFVFQVGSTLTTASASKVQFIHGAQSCHAYWQVGSSATLGSSSTFAGSVLANTSITANYAATIDGRLLARSGAVTLDTDTVTAQTCAPTISTSKTVSPASRVAPGGSFTYTVGVTNTGDGSVSLTSLSDSVYGDLDGVGTCATGGELAAGDTYTCTFAESFTGSSGASQTGTTTATVTDVTERTATADATTTVTLTAATPATGYLEICKKADNSHGRVTGSYQFALAGRTVTVPVGTCTGPLKVPAGEVSVVETAAPGVRMSACNTWPITGLRLCDPAHSRSVVHVVQGGVAKETILSITNRLMSDSDTGAIKVCKVAGPGVALGTGYSFTVGSRTVSVPAGPAAQGGYCKILNGFTRGRPVTVTEVASNRTHVSQLTVQPVARQVAKSLTNRYATVTVQASITVVTFTNTANAS